MHSLLALGHNQMKRRRQRKKISPLHSFILDSDMFLLISDGYQMAIRLARSFVRFLSFNSYTEMVNGVFLINNAITETSSLYQHLHDRIFISSRLIVNNAFAF